MIAFLRGALAHKGVGSAVVDVAGVGYEVAMPTGSLAGLPAEGDQVLVLTYMHVREDGMSLFGFLSAEEKRLFERLIGVSGVGPKVALAVLSAIAPDAFADAVAREDVASLSSVPGVGKKTAQRMIVDLKDRLGVPELSTRGAKAAPDAFAEARDALLAMGFTAVESAAALKGAEGDAQALLKQALRRLGGGA